MRDSDTSPDAPDEVCRITLKNTSKEAKLHITVAVSFRCVLGMSAPTLSSDAIPDVFLAHH